MSSSLVQISKLANTVVSLVSATQLCFWKCEKYFCYPTRENNWTNSSIRLFAQCIYLGKQINKFRELECILRYWFCYWYGSAGLTVQSDSDIEWWFECVCVCVNRTQVSTSHASANISSPPVIAGLMWADGWMIAAPWRRMSGFDTCHITLTHAQISDQWAEITGWNLKVLCPLHSLTQTKFCGEFSMSGRSVLSLWVSFFIWTGIFSCVSCLYSCLLSNTFLVWNFLLYFCLF